MLQRLEVKNFLALRDVSIDLEPFTVIVGPNASGKSTILEALHRLCMLKAGQSAVLISGTELLDRPGQTIEKSSPAEILAWKAEPIIILKTITSIGEVRVVFTLTDVSSDDWNFSLRTDFQKDFPETQLHNFDGYLQALPFGLDKLVPNSIKLHPNSQKMSLASSSPLPKPILEQDGAGLATVCANIQQISPDVFSRIQESLQKLIPSFVRFRIQRANATAKNFVNGEALSSWTGIAEELIFDFTDAVGVPAKHVSEGTLLALCILTAAARFEDEAVVFIDDLERGLHPKAVHDLVKTLRELQKINPKLQIIATSHSPYVLDELEPHEVRVVTRDSDLGTVVGKLSDHPNFEKWKDAMLPGEFWSHVGEDWLLKQTQNA